MNITRSETIEEIREIVSLIEKNKFNIRDIKALLIDLRSCQKEGELIIDIANFVAHPDHRDRGRVVLGVNSFMKHTIEFFVSGGELKVELLFSRQKILDSFVLCISQLGINIKKDLSDHIIDKFMNYILDIVQNTNLELKNQHVIECYLSKIEVEKDKKTIAVCLKLTNLPANSVLKFREETTLCFPAFEVKNLTIVSLIKHLVKRVFEICTVWCAVDYDQELIKKHYTSRYPLRLYCDEIDKKIQRVGLTNGNLRNQRSQFLSV